MTIEAAAFVVVRFARGAPDAGRVGADKLQILEALVFGDKLLE
jgi:hypothetical protein